MNESAFEVKYISGDAPTQLRKAHLRTAGMAPYKNYPTADEPGNFHLGAYMDGELAAAASFLQERCPHFDEAIQYRLRGMVTHPDYRGMGMGTHQSCGYIKRASSPHSVVRRPHIRCRLL